MNYISTRGFNQPKYFADVVLEGLAPDGGLYMPENWPRVSIDTTSYATIVASLIDAFAGDTFTKEELADLTAIYDDRTIFRDPAIAPLRPLQNNLMLLELFHGPTLSFKDYALQLVGRFFGALLERQNKNITVLGATSGDTGSAAIHALKYSRRIKTVILHPHNRTSSLQRKQMTTILEPHIHNIALEGTFDDCQNLVKHAFQDGEVQSHCHLSAINSINWLRIIAQSAYYFCACKQAGKPISISVPTGNFGNILSAWIAKKLGAPIEKLVISSNANDILTRLFETGALTGDDVVASYSPSMDIQISSNFERYLFEIMGRDGAAVKQHMDEFKKTKTTPLPKEILEKARVDFMAFRCSDAETLQTIADIYKNTGIIIDPHTAVGVHAAKLSGITGPLVCVATAHPAKFPETVLKATGKAPGIPEPLQNIGGREERFTTLPNNYDTLKKYLLAL